MTHAEAIKGAMEMWNNLMAIAAEKWPNDSEEVRYEKVAAKMDELMGF